MRVVVQRVERAAVRALDADGADERCIDRGLVLLAGFTATDQDDVIGWMAEKCLTLRIFPDDDGNLNRSVHEAGGAILVVPNFTLYGDARKGRRPSFTRAAAPERAQKLFGRFVERLQQGPIRIESGWFQAHMHVELVNDGPITLLLERD